MALDKKKFQVYNSIKFIIKNNKQNVVIDSEIANRLDKQELEEYLYTIGYVNFDIDRIADAIDKASGNPEEIGPVFKKYNKEKDRKFSVKVDSMEAVLTLYEQEDYEEKIDYYDILFKLRNKKVNIDAILVDEIKNAIAEKKYSLPIVVAKGEKPINGKDAIINFKISIKESGHPEELENGKVDLRSLNNVIMVKKDQVLAEKIPFTLGEDGYDIFGNVISPTPGNDIGLPAGKNVLVTEDGLKMVASLDGFVYESSQGINIGDVFMVNSDLDYSVGNIEYDSDVVIKGNVLPGFTINAGGDVMIMGDVEGAEINSKRGNIVIKKGIFGETKIEAEKGDVELTFIQGESKVKGKNISIQKFSYGASLDADEDIRVPIVVGGFLRAKRIIELDVVGSENNTKTELMIWDEKYALLIKEIKGYEDKEKEKKEDFKRINKSIIQIKELLAKNSGQLSKSVKLRAAQTLEKFKKIKSELAELSEKLALYRGESEKIKRGQSAIIVSKTIWPNTSIVFYGEEKKVIDKISSRKVYSLNPEIE